MGYLGAWVTRTLVWQGILMFEGAELFNLRGAVAHMSEIVIEHFKRVVKNG